VYAQRRVGGPVFIPSRAARATTGRRTRAAGEGSPSPPRPSSALANRKGRGRRINHRGAVGPMGSMPIDWCEEAGIKSVPSVGRCQPLHLRRWREASSVLGCPPLPPLSCRRAGPHRGGGRAVQLSRHVCLADGLVGKPRDARRVPRPVINCASAPVQHTADAAARPRRLSGSGRRPRRASPLPPPPPTTPTRPRQWPPPPPPPPRPPPLPT